jgi:hypothetical protein
MLRIMAWQQICAFLGPDAMVYFALKIATKWNREEMLP